MSAVRGVQRAVTTGATDLPDRCAEPSSAAHGTVGSHRVPTERSNAAAEATGGAAAAAAVLLSSRIAGIDWARVAVDLDARGHALIGPLLDAQECAAIAGMYDAADEHLFRSRVVMARHGFGRGEYRYFAYPLPRQVDALRSALYPRLAPIANRWEEALGQRPRFPETHGEFLAECRAAGQTRPTPLLLRYGVDDYNCLHQDLYGDQVFPLQVALLLNEPQIDFTGGEFVLTEQRPRMQSRVDVVPLTRGMGVVFAVNQRPMQRASGQGCYRVAMRHGVSRLRSGRRHTLGIIFHDAI